jgi:hypothetical protein
MEYKYLDCDFQPCELYTSLDSKKCEFLGTGKPSSRMNKDYTVYAPAYPGSHIYRAQH